MTEPYQPPVARIRNADGCVVGAGFLAPGGVIITCTHVVNDSLGRPDKLEASRPEAGAFIAIDLPWVAGDRKYSGTIID